jgi:hypothetical protein
MEFRVFGALDRSQRPSDGSIEGKMNKKAENSGLFEVDFVYFLLLGAVRPEGRHGFT